MTSKDRKACSNCSGGCGQDADAGFRVGSEYRRFNQKNDIFNRSFWDPTVRSEGSARFYESYRKPLEEWRHVDGYAQRDFALRNAGWHVADFFAERLESGDRREGFLDFLTAQREGAETQVPFESPKEASREVKRVAKLFGADLVGIARRDERWIYTHKYSRQREDAVPADLPEGLDSVIVCAHEMDASLLRTVPSALSGTATGLGYSRDAITLLALVQYLRNLGYRAVASMNDTAATIPFAIQAGLGEYGRHGLLITPELGPRLRLGKIFTDLPLQHDRPRKFGVEAFCGVCRRCSDECPPQAIPSGEPSSEPPNCSSVEGVTKWTTDAERCFGFWVKQVTDCSICLRVCPYNRPGPRWLQWLRVRAMGSPLRRLMLWIDRVGSGGARLAPRRWWQQLRHGSR